MGDWSYLSTLLHKVQSHSTVVGKIWMSVLFLFRIFMLGTAVDKVWGDEVSEFKCDTMEPGCTHVCYNWMFPISYMHYWVLQIIFVSTPTLVYLGHAVHIIHKERKMLEQQKKNPDDTTLKKPKYIDDRGKVKIKGILFGTYMTQLVVKIFLEVAFSVGQFYIYGSVFMVSDFKCTLSPPCALSGAQCYISRPTEKTIFVIFMLVVSGISVLLNIIEIIYLLSNKRREDRRRIQVAKKIAGLQQHPANPAWGGMSSHFGDFSLPPPPSHGMTDFCVDENKEKDY